MIRIKVCGVTTPSDAAEISALGADAVGLNFIKASPRFVEPGGASTIVSELKPSTMAIGLFDYDDDILFCDLAEAAKINVFQIYNWKDRYLFEPRRYIDTARIRDEHDLEVTRQRIQERIAAGAEVPYALIVDSHSTAALGGTGTVAPWHLLASFDPGVPVILAGGLTPDNVAEAIRIVQPWGVDVASGVESRPGAKDRGKVKAFIQAAREAAAAL